MSKTLIDPSLLATTIPISIGGTGQTTYTDGQLLIGDSSTNGLDKATITGTSNQVIITNGHGSITLSLPQAIATTSSPFFAGVYATVLIQAATLQGKSEIIAGVGGSSTGQLLLENASNSNFVTISAPTVTTSYSLALPVAQGGASTLLQNDGSGNLSWANTLSITRMTLNGNLSFTNTATEGILGTVTNDSAAAGNVGEYVKSTGTAVNFPANGAYGDICSIALSAGDWDVTGVAVFHLNGATMTGIGMGISVNAGNVVSGLSEGDTSLNLPPAPTSDESGTLPAVRISLASSGNAYLKFIGIYSSGTPQAWGRISARRVR